MKLAQITALVALMTLVSARPEPPAPVYGAPSSIYGAPANAYSAPSSNYGAPANAYSAPSSNYGAPANAYSAPSSNYGAPTNAYSAPSSTYGAPANSYSSRYSAPSRPAVTVSSRLGGGRGSSRKSALSSNYGAPAVTAAVFRSAAPSSTYGAPSSTYGAPEASSRLSGAPAPVYGPPNGGYQYDDARARLAQDDLSEPASYEYSYAVQDDQSGSDFGHQETREEESAQGEYRVLLPDGRTQIVEYEADEGGYRPLIRYEEPKGPYAASRSSHGGPY